MSLRALRGGESVVVALTGRWGTGKSSLKNLILHVIGASEEKPVDVLEFNPWQFTGKQDIARAFFMEVGIALGHTDGSSSDEKREQAWTSYAAYLQLTDASLGAFRSLFVTLWSLAVLISAWSSVIG